MTNIMIMTIFDGTESLTHDKRCFTFLKVFPLFNDVEEFSTLTQSILSCRLTP